MSGESRQKIDIFADNDRYSVIDDVNSDRASGESRQVSSKTSNEVVSGESRHITVELAYCSNNNTGK